MDDDAPNPYDLLADPRLTTVGLLLETDAGLRAAIEADLDRHGMSGSEFEVLIRLARSPEHRLRMSALARQATLSNSGLTRVVDRLAQDGSVERVRHPQDRRVYFAVLTSVGLERVLAVLPDHLARVDAVLTNVLTPSEQEALVHALYKLRAVLKPGADPALNRIG